jgi:uncharacterized membrane protein YdbT with pleckstrin-like domain
MSKVLYEASPSMIRMNPFATVAVLLLLCAGIAVAVPMVASALVGALPEALGASALEGKWVSIAGMVIAALAFFKLLAWYIATKVDRLVIKDGEIVWVHGLLSKQYTEINMGSVRTVRVTQSLLQRIMGAGDVTVFTSGDLPEVVIRGLPDPDRIREYVKGEVPD